MSSDYAAVAELADAFLDGVEALTHTRPLWVEVGFPFTELVFPEASPEPEPVRRDVRSQGDDW